MHSRIVLQKDFEGKKLIIRYPQKSDVALMLKYINTLSKEKTYIRFQGEQLTLKEETKYLKGLLEKINKKQAVHLQMFLDNSFIGDSSITLKDKVESHLGRLGISIAKEYREKGLGTLLLNTVIKEAQKNLPGLKIIILEVYANNPRAIHIYKKMGFKPYGKLPKGIRYKNKFVDSIFMYRNVL